MGEGNGNPLQYSCLENSMDRGAWQAAVHGIERSLSLYRKHYKFRNHEVEFHVSSYLVQFPDTIKQ